MDRVIRPVRAAVVVAVVAGVFSPSGRTQRLLIVLTVVIGVLASSAAASPFSSGTQALQALVRAQLNPRPLYPDILPLPLGSNNSATFTHGHFFVWKGPNTNPAWFSIKYRCRCNFSKRNDLVTAAFSRGPVSDIAKAINLSQNVQGHAVGRVRFHRRRMYRFQMDKWFGYMWRHQGFAYSVFARYSPRVGWGFMRKFVESLYPLGRLWSGHTSQGWPVSVYLSRGGVDWTVFSVLQCADGSRLKVDIDEDLVGINHGGTFSDSYSFPWLADHGMLQHEMLSMRGKLPASADASATGSFDAHTVSVRHPRARYWNCGAQLSWEAGPV